MHIYVTGVSGKLGSALLRRILQINLQATTTTTRDSDSDSGSESTANDLRWLTDPSSGAELPVTVTAVDIVPLPRDLVEMMAKSNEAASKLASSSSSSQGRTASKSRFVRLDLAGHTSDGWKAVERSMMGDDDDDLEPDNEAIEGCGWKRKDGRRTDCEGGVIHFGAVPNPIK